MRKETLEHHRCILWIMRMTIALVRLVGALEVHAIESCALSPRETMVTLCPSHALVNVYPVGNERFVFHVIEVLRCCYQINPNASKKIAQNQLRFTMNLNLPRDWSVVAGH
jgi:hypothetical protein